MAFVVDGRRKKKLISNIEFATQNMKATLKVRESLWVRRADGRRETKSGLDLGRRRTIRPRPPASRSAGTPAGRRSRRDAIVSEFRFSSAVRLFYLCTVYF